MLFLKKLFLGIIAIALILIGGSGTQSSNFLTQGGGIIGIVAGLVVLYIFGKLVWKAVGCLPSFIIFSGFCLFILYAIGAFNNGIENVIPNLQKFIGVGDNASSEDDFEAIDINAEEENSNINIDESFEKIGNIKPSEEDIDLPKPNEKIQKMQPEQEDENKKGGVMGFISEFLGHKEPQNIENFNPRNYPAIYGQVAVESGDTLIMNGRYIRLFGIDAPEIRQTCMDSQGKKYACGQEAINWLKQWLQDYEIECNVIKQNSRGNVVGVCSIGEYDIGAALVAAGWAISLPNNSVYGPYEQQAKMGHRGMWQGWFYKPWDWVKIQSAKPKVIIKKRKRKSKKTKRLWDFL